MDLGKFPYDMDALNNVSNAISDYIDYGDKLTSGASTSLFNLIRESLTMFFKFVEKDYEEVFG